MAGVRQRAADPRGSCTGLLDPSPPPRLNGGLDPTGRAAGPRDESRPPRQTDLALPALAEARPEGAFDKESFLRALVVQLARTIEDHHGPDAAEAAVAQVGMDVGGQMEQEFRLAKHLDGTMTPDELGCCYVRLKHAIDGDFTVVEATPKRLVLENTRCPFGDVVQTPVTMSRPPLRIAAIPKATAMSFRSLLRFSGESAPIKYHEPQTMPPTPARANSIPTAW